MPCPRCGSALLRADADGYVAQCCMCRFCAFDSTRKYTDLAPGQGAEAVTVRDL